MLKNINLFRLSIIILLIGILSVVGYFVSFALDEGGFENTSWVVTAILTFFEWLFILIAFPVYFFIDKSWFNEYFYFAVIGIDCVIYAFIIELAILKYRQYKPKKSS